jgi:ribose/xylose/arabinose/galactoside ABC-type transport system permease subunit
MVESDVPTVRREPARTLPGLHRGIGDVLRSEYLVLALTILYFLIMWPIVPEIAQPATLVDIVAAMGPLLVVAIGQTFVLIVAGIDLSAPSILAVAAVVGASVMTGDGGYLAGSPLAVPGGILVFLAIGCGIGWLNGASVTALKMPPFIVTLSTMMFFSGTAIWYTALHTDATSIGNLPPAFIAIGQTESGGGLIALLIAATVAVTAHVVLSRTVFGRWLYAIGTNPVAAEVSGVPVRRAIIGAFVVSGLTAGIASILYTGRLETGSPVLGQRILLDIVGAAVIGGVSLFGGKGKVVWTLFGVLFLSIIDKSLQLLGLSQSWVLATKGGVILTAAVIDAARHRLLTRR